MLRDGRLAERQLVGGPSEVERLRNGDVISTLASAGCACSVTVEVLIAMRIVQGIGGAMMLPQGRAHGTRTLGLTAGRRRHWHGRRA